MTDQIDAMPEPQWGHEEPPPEVSWGDAHPLERRPQALDGDEDRPLANHVFTISFTPKGQPMVVVRANTARSVSALLEELHAEGVYGQLAAAQQALQQAAPPVHQIIQQLGATVVGTEPGYGQPGMGYPGPAQPGYGGPPAQPAMPPQYGAPPAAQQGGWGQAPPPGAGAPAGWFRVRIPYPQKDAGELVKNQLKAQNLYQNNVKWDGPTKSWLVSPTVAQWFAQWNPVPA